MSAPASRTVFVSLIQLVFAGRRFSARLNHFLAPLVLPIWFVAGGPCGVAVCQESARQDRSRIYQPDSAQQRAELRPAQPIPIQPGPHLLVDDALIDSSEHLQRRVEPPRRDGAIGNPIVRGADDRCFQPYLTVSRSPETGRFRMWFGAWREDRDTNHSHLAYIESADGIHWDRPARILEDPGILDFGSEVIDRGPDHPDRSQRYIYSYYRSGLRLAVSANGWKFRPLVDRAVVEHDHDINNLSWDPLRKHFVATVSTRTTHPLFSGRRRTTMQSVSADLLKWPAPWYVLRADDALDDGETQFYGLQGFLTRGPLRIGMVKILRDDLRAEGTEENSYGMGWTTLAWSRDGLTWVRDRKVFFGPDPESQAWDHAHAWIDEQLIVDDEVFLYYGGYKQGHKMNRFSERQIGLVKSPLDRYVARQAQAGKTARLTTVSFHVNVNAAHFIVNADAVGGMMRVQIDSLETGKAIPGLDFSGCRPIREDGVRLPVLWGDGGNTTEKLLALRGRNVRVRFELQAARLFSFDLTESDDRAAAD